LETERVLVDEPASFPAMAFDGANYLLAWGYNTATTNADITIHARFVDGASGALGSIFTPFQAQGGQPPLLPINGLRFDGARFLLAATFGAYALDAGGDIVGFSGGDVYGMFIPQSNTQPIFTNVTLANGLFQGELLVVPGQTYTIESSTNLADWEPIGVLASGETNRLVLTESADIMALPNLFYRAVIGDRLGVSHDLHFIEFAAGGNFGGGLTPSVNYPVVLQGYEVLLDMMNAASFPAATNVHFTGPAGSGLSNTPADPANSWVGETEAAYASPVVASPPAAPGGAWTVSYPGTNLVFDLPDSQAASRLVVMVPTVDLNGGLVRSVSWGYRDAATGAALTGPPAYMTSIQVQIEGITGGRVYDSPALPPNATSHTLEIAVGWTNVSAINMTYDDSLGNHYVVTFSKP
jgi:hypothetical protein